LGNKIPAFAGMSSQAEKTRQAGMTRQGVNSPRRVSPPFGDSAGREILHCVQNL